MERDYMNENVLSEVYGVVNAMGVKYKEKIPKHIWSIIEGKRNKDYVPFIDKNKRLGEQNISREAIVVISMLHRDYWCESDEERAKLDAIFEANEQKYNEKIASASSIRKRLRLIKNR